MADFGAVRVNQLDHAGTAWLAELLRVIETLDAHAYTRLMTEDVTLQLSDGTVLRGRVEIEAALAAAWAPLQSLIHRGRNIYGSASHLAHEADVDFVGHDGTRTTVTTTSWIDRADNGLLRSARLYG